MQFVTVGYDAKSAKNSLDDSKEEYSSVYVSDEKVLVFAICVKSWYKWCPFKTHLYLAKTVKKVGVYRHPVVDVFMLIIFCIYYLKLVKFVDLFIVYSHVD